MIGGQTNFNMIYQKSSFVEFTATNNTTPFYSMMSFYASQFLACMQFTNNVALIVVINKQKIKAINKRLK